MNNGWILRRTAGIIVAIAVAGACAAFAKDGPGKSRKSGQSNPAGAEPTAAVKNSTDSPEAIISNPTVVLLRDPAIHRELRLDEDQVHRVEAALAPAEQPLWVLRDLPAAQSAPRFRQLVNQVAGAIEPILTTDQSRRLDELVLQARGVAGLSVSTYVERLQLSPKQARQILQLVTSTQESVNKIQKEQSPTPSSVQSRVEKARQEERHKILAVLSEKQKQMLKSMVGEPFDFSQVRRLSSRAPDFANITRWINSQPLSIESLRGKVVALHFYAFG